MAKALDMGEKGPWQALKRGKENDKKEGEKEKRDHL